MFGGPPIGLLFILYTITYRPIFDSDQNATGQIGFWILLMTPDFCGLTPLAVAIIVKLHAAFTSIIYLPGVLLYNEYRLKTIIIGVKNRLIIILWGDYNLKIWFFLKITHHL